MTIFLGIVLAFVTVLALAGVLAALIWAAKKDGDEDRAVQQRLGIHRHTRLGR